MKNLRIFWTCELDEGADGYYYHYWDNWLTNKHEAVFAGYNKKAVNKKSTSWKAVKARLLLDS
jgi:hypothetical protein